LNEKDNNSTFSTKAIIVVGKMGSGKSSFVREITKDNFKGSI